MFFPIVLMILTFLMVVFMIIIAASLDSLDDLIYSSAGSFYQQKQTISSFKL